LQNLAEVSENYRTGLQNLAEMLAEVSGLAISVVVKVKDSGLAFTELTKKVSILAITNLEKLAGAHYFSCHIFLGKHC
jgi:hypothetical protein